MKTCVHEKYRSPDSETTISGKLIALHQATLAGRIRTKVNDCTIMCHVNDTRFGSQEREKKDTLIFAYYYNSLIFIDKKKCHINEDVLDSLLIQKQIAC